MKHGSKHYLMASSFGLIDFVAMLLVPYEKQGFEGFLPFFFCRNVKFHACPDACYLHVCVCADVKYTSLLIRHPIVIIVYFNTFLQKYNLIFVLMIFL